ncbi:hypothetical protein C463_12977 [Halorubrum californiense DSM 19288]|uniref:Uncharacterized protein n=1 Tax=Halorubrum californiense DSM 19288 TaxID=1227465 RepID=M0E1C5_9EURY|nr:MULTISPECIES: hypothetical protein [Halorubrum]ELZ41595.1 hypothetical protein C463_12977 [Halorubrum californiense DSM 19288]TKX69780.1 hypothetical protein EXE40_10285 [Halorubrum sp. GN11GM_10-3_MGM]
MRRVTRNVVIAIALVVVALLALGALPSYLGSGDPYYLTVEPIETNDTAADVNNVSDRRYPYLIGAIASEDGRSDPYQTGPYGMKEWFTHTPFDEVDALTRQVPNASTETGVRVRRDGEVYHAEVVRP